MAKQSAKDVDARFYADQAQRVMIGEPTYLECRIPQVSNEKLAKRMEEVKKIYGDMNVKMKDLQDIEAKLTETREKIKDAEIKKEEATVKLDELNTRAATASPEEKAEVDDLVRLAQEQEQIADQQLNQAKQSEKDALNKKEQLENELENMRSQVQAKIQAGNK
jgi:chromosome segregation ATPase